MAEGSYGSGQEGAEAVDGQPLSAAEFKEALQTVRNGAIRLLARREHSRAELRNKLLLRSHPLGMINTVIEQLAERGLQSDVRFAESYTRMRIRRGYGGNKIRAELLSRDVPREIIEQALAETDECWIENATHVLQKKYAKYAKNDCNPRDMAKMQRFLWSRGYNSDEVKLAIERLREN